MNRAKKAACLMLMCVAPLVASARQGGPDKKTSADQQAKTSPEKITTLDPSDQHILAALNQLCDSQQSFSDETLRIVMRLRIADMMWTYDEARARNLFKEAFEAFARAQAANPEFSTSKFPHRPVAGMVAQSIVARDPALAARLAESLRDDASNNQSWESLRYQLAQILAMKDYRLALQVLKPIADSGNVATLVPLLKQIKMRERMANRGKPDAKGADDLFIRAFEKVRLGQPSLEEIRQLASYLFPSFENGVLVYPARTDNVDRFKPIPMDDAVIRQFFDMAYKTVSSRLDASTGKSDDALSFFDHTMINLMLPYFDRFIPDRAATIRAIAEEATRRASQADQPNPPMEEWGTVQELLAKAEGIADSEQRDRLYQRASTMAIFNRNLDQASTIIEKISNEKVRDNQRENWNIRSNQFYPEDAARAVDKADFDKAETLIAGIQDPYVRIRAFGYLIAGLFQQDRPRAIKMLDEAVRAAAKIENRIDRSRRLMGLAGIAARIDASRGFEEMKLAIEEFNRAGFASEWEKGESPAEPGRGKTRVNIGLSPLLDDESFYQLGSADFERALAVAQRIQLREASALVQLAACRGALSKHQPAALARPIGEPEKPQEPGKAKQ
jgi:hypothetical protein